MSIVGGHPESGLRLVLERPRDGGPPWTYEGAAYTPTSTHPLRVVVQADGTVEVQVEDATSRGLIQRTRQMVRAAYKHAEDQGLPPPRDPEMARLDGGSVTAPWRRRMAGLAFVAATVASIDARAGASSAGELVREAREHEAAREDDVAVRRYTEALALDPTCAQAYLGLGALRARRGDFREAERVYAMALDHAPDLYAALAGRAHARRALGALREADEDLDRYATETRDLGALRELAEWYAAEGRTSAQLASWRRLYAAALEIGDDPALLREARATVRALQIFVGPADPVVSPDTRDPARRSLAAIARRGG